jgi:type I restriction enzyme R subunit
VDANFKAWLTQQKKDFTEEKIRWLEMIKDHIAGNLSIDTDDFEYAPFSQAGGIGRVCQLFGEELNIMLDELNERLVA